MQAIITRYIPATNYKPSRIKASCARGKVILSCDALSGDGRDSDEMTHIRAASILVARFAVEDFAKYGTPHGENPWNKPRVVGQLPSGEMAHVFLS